MPISSSQEAHEILQDPFPDGVPFEAITYLQQQETTDDLIDTICYWMAHAYDDTSEDPRYRDLSEEERPEFFWEPLWYGIVAEAHLDLRLGEPLLRLFDGSLGLDYWDYLTEQYAYLAGHLAKAWPETIPPLVLTALERTVGSANKGDRIYFLFETFLFLDTAVHGPRLLALLKNPRFPLAPELAGAMADIGYTAALPILRDLRDIEALRLKLETDSSPFSNMDIGELEHAVERLEGRDKTHYPPQHEIRSPWRVHYAKLDEDLRYG